MTEESTKTEKVVETTFESWFGGLMWPDPYPDYETIARAAWEAACKVTKQTNK